MFTDSEIREKDYTASPPKRATTTEEGIIPEGPSVRGVD
jgi:hypothetical protein